jgi:hypothetical protein
VIYPIPHPNSSGNLVCFFLSSLLSSFTMTGSFDDNNKGVVHSSCTRGIIQHFQWEVRLQVEGLDDDLRTTNEHLGQLETT